MSHLSAAVVPLVVPQARCSTVFTDPDVVASMLARVGRVCCLKNTVGGRERSWYSVEARSRCPLRFIHFGQFGLTRNLYIDKL